MDRVRAKLEKDTFLVGLWLGLGQNSGRYLCGRPLVRARVKKEDSLCGRSLVNVRGKKKDDICGMPLVRVKAKIENTSFLVGLWLGLRKRPLLQAFSYCWVKNRQNALCGWPMFRDRAKI